MLTPFSKHFLFLFLLEGEVMVGKITYYSNEVLGHGSEGTMVFKLVAVYSWFNCWCLLVV